jgi:hypothetical protein
LLEAVAARGVGGAIALQADNAVGVVDADEERAAVLVDEGADRAEGRGEDGGLVLRACSTDFQRLFELDLAALTRRDELADLFDNRALLGFLVCEPVVVGGGLVRSRRRRGRRL